jgi:diguanylate cyclase (GGDEF)-like protein/PAS domain S-box-containing protein
MSADSAGMDQSPVSHLLLTLGQSISVLNESGRVKSVTGSIEHILGYPAEQRIGRPAIELIHPSDKDEMFRAFVDVVTGKVHGSRHSVRAIHLNGTHRSLSITLRNAVQDKHINGIVMCAQVLPNERITDADMAVWNDPLIRPALTEALATLRAIEGQGYESDDGGRVAALEAVLAATGASTVALLVNSNAKAVVRLFAAQDRNGVSEHVRLPIAIEDFAPWMEPGQLHMPQAALELTRSTMPDSWRSFTPENSGERVLLLPMDWGVRSGFVVLTTDGSTDIARAVAEEIARITTNPVAHWVTRRSLQRAQNNRMATLLKHSADLVILLNKDFHVTYASPVAVAAMGIKPKLEGGFLLTHPVLSPAEVAAFTQGVAPAESFVTELPVTSITGEPRVYRLTMTNLLHDPEVHGWLVNAQDVTDRVSSERESLANAKRRSAIAEATTLLSNSTPETIVQDLAKPLNSLRILTNSPKCGVWLSEPGQDAKSVIELVPSSTLPLGFKVPDLKTAELHRIISPDMDLVGPGDQNYECLLDLINVSGAPEIAFGMFLPIRINGRLRGLAVLIRFDDEPFERTDLDTARSIGATISGALSRCEAVSQLAIQARTDALTGLANRRALDSTMDAIRNRPASVADGAAALFCDVDDFKFINDTLGHDAGDTFLAELANRLSATCRLGDLVARVGGDEFVIILPLCNSANEVLSFATRILETIREPITLAGRVIRPSICVGVAFETAEQLRADGAERLIANADLALLVAKGRGSGEVEIFNNQMAQSATERLSLLSAMGESIENNDFVLHFQPIVDVTDQTRLRGFEGLLRWENQGRAIGPDVFIPLAERSGVIGRLTSIVITQGIRQLSQWRTQGVVDDDVTLSLNVSGHDLRSPNLIPQIAYALATFDVPADRIHLELTESSSIDVASVLETLNDLRALGVGLSIDDFGTGYASLSYLRDLPASIVKVDQSFTRNIADVRDRSLIAASIAMGHQLGMEVIAEGVETIDQLNRLVELGCDMAQGYLISRPMAASAVPSWIAEHTSAHELINA